MKNKLGNTFYEESSNDFLQQGDILYTKVLDDEIYTDEKIHLSESVYPYFFKNYYLCVVLNASCDLVFGSKRTSKVECLQLVALSPLEDTLQNIISSFSDPVMRNSSFYKNIVSQKNYNKIAEEFRKIIDGQHKTKFFLPEILFPNLKKEDEESLNFPWVAKLDVIVSLRFKNHSAFIKSKTGIKLEPQRASKLAENTANLFNRIALDDVKEILGNEHYKTWVDEQLFKFCSPIFDPVYFSALPDLKKLIKEEKNNSNSPDKILDIIEKHKNVKQYPEEINFLKKIEKILHKNDIDPKNLGKIISEISMDSEFKNLFKK